MAEIENGNGNGNGKVRVAFSSQISLGNVLTIVGMVGWAIYIQTTVVVSLRDDVEALQDQVCELRGIAAGLPSAKASFECRSARDKQFAFTP